MNTRLYPILGYLDARAAIDFLIDTFGFEEVLVHDDPSKKIIYHAELSWPHGGFVMVNSADSEANSIKGLSAFLKTAGGYPSFSIHILTPEPDALYARVQAAGASIVRELADSPLGTRGFIAADPEGLYWSFGTKLPPLVRDQNGMWKPAT